MKARIEYVTLVPGESIQIGSATVTPCMLNHPVIDFGYRIESNGKSVFFTGDHEPPYNIYQPGDEGYDEYQVFVDEKATMIHEAIQGVDVFIADSSYTDTEYPSKKGWGHGTFSSSIASAKRANAKVLFCTHHEPTRSDDALELAFAEAIQSNAATVNGMDIRLAREGDCYEF
jgi:ribonuclease BN (tRNA processing enzyme)